MRVQRFGLCIAASLALGLLVVGPAAAAEDEYAAVRDKLKACFACHGKNGVSDDPQIPVLAGQHMFYTYVQLKDFQAGRRISPVMTEIMTGRTVAELFANGSQPGRSDLPVMTEVAAFLTKEEMRAIATFFSEQPWPGTGYKADPARARMGEVATVAGQPGASGGAHAAAKTPSGAAGQREPGPPSAGPWPATPTCSLNGAPVPPRVCGCIRRLRRQLRR